MTHFKKIISGIHPRLTVVAFVLQILSFAVLFAFVLFQSFINTYEGDYAADPGFAFALLVGFIFMFSVPMSLMQLLSYLYLRFTSEVIQSTLLNTVTRIFSVLILALYLIGSIF